MKKILISLLLVLSFFMSGCGSDTPEDVAKEYVNLLSEGKIKSMKGLVKDEKQIKDIYFETDYKTKNLEKGLKDIFDTSTKYYDIYNGKFYNPKYEKMGIDALKEINKKFKDKSSKEYYKAVEGAVEKIFNKIYKDKLKAKVASLIFMRKKYEAIDYYKEAMYKKADKIEPYSYIPKIDIINIIHTKKNEDGDTATVKLEIIFDNGKSKKYNVYLEKIKGKWKVTDTDF